MGGSAVRLNLEFLFLLLLFCFFFIRHLQISKTKGWVEMISAKLYTHEIAAVPQLNCF